MDKNIFFNSEKFGLRIIGALEYSSGSHEFDTRVVWVAKDGRLLTARDSGCSCPTPFDDLTLKDLEDITVEYDSFLRTEWKSAPNYEREQVSLVELDDLIAKCREGVK